MFKIPIENPIWEALAADADALQDAVAAQLVQHEAVLHGPWAEARNLSSTHTPLQMDRHPENQPASYQGFWFRWELYSAQSEGE